MKNIFLLLAILFTFIACDSEPPRWENTHGRFFADDQEVIYIKHGKELDYYPSTNGDVLEIRYTENDSAFKLYVHSNYHKIHSFYFDGYDAEDFNDEIKEITRIDEYTIQVNGDALNKKPLYEFSISEDHHKR